MAAEAVAADQELEAAPVQRELWFTSPRGERLHGLLVDTGSEDVVILCHGYIANFNDCQFPLIAAALAAAGVSSYRFDHAMAVKSKSERQGPFRMGNHADEVADYAAAAAMIRAQGRRVACLLGHSKGGVNVLLYASRHGDIPRMVSLSGRFRVRDGVLQRFGADIFDRLKQGPVPCNQGGFDWELSEEDCRGRAGLDMTAAARAIPPTVRVLLLHGRQDRTIPCQESEEAAGLIANSQLVLVDGDHNFRAAADAERMAAEVVRFVTQG